MIANLIAHELAAVFSCQPMSDRGLTVTKAPVEGKENSAEPKCIASGSQRGKRILLVEMMYKAIHHNDIGGANGGGALTVEFLAIE